MSKNKVLISAVIALVVLVIAAFFFFSGKIFPKPYYLETEELGFDLSGLPVFMNSVKVGEISKKLDDSLSDRDLYRIRFTKKINIPEKSEIIADKKGAGAEYGILIRLVPSDKYYQVGDTLKLAGTFFDDSSVEEQKPEKLRMHTETPEKGNVKAEQAAPDKNLNILFKVQIIASRDKIPDGSQAFKGVKDIKEIKENGWYKYFAGESGSLDEVLRIKKKMVEMGFKDAFVIAYRNGQRISIKEALALKNKS